MNVKSRADNARRGGLLEKIDYFKLKMKKQTFEEFLNDRCPSELQTNNGPEGFERWLETQDVADIMEYAEFYGQLCRVEGQKELLEEMRVRLKVDVN